MYVYDLTPLSHPQVHKTFYKNHKNKNTRKFRYILVKKPKDFFNLLKEICNSKIFLAIDLLNDEISSNIVRIILKLKKVKRLILRCGELPCPKKKQKSFPKKMVIALNKISRKVCIKFVFHAIVNKVCKPNIYVCAGKKSIPLQKNNSAQVIKAHSFDYDKQIFESKNHKKQLGKKIVFLDEDMCFHPDYNYLNEKPVVKPKKYFEQLQNTFLQIEKRFNKKVVIAAHPRARYSNKEKKIFFGKRDVVLNQTINLVKNCSLILAHASTSLSFAVLHKKPVFLLSNSELSKSPFGERILAFSKALDAPIVFMDNLDNSSLETLRPLVNKHSYNQYKNDYIRENLPTKKIPLWEIISKKVFKKAI